VSDDPLSQAVGELEWTRERLRQALNCLQISDARIESLTEELQRAKTCMAMDRLNRLDDEIGISPRPTGPVRARMLREAATVTEERGKTYGPPAEHFERTVRAAYALMPDLFARPPEPEDWGKLMCIDKLARDAEVAKADNMIDLAGYAACVHECRSVDQATDTSSQL
jgi:hypothetical protein